MAKQIVHASLPAFSAFAECVQNVSVKADAQNLFLWLPQILTIHCQLFIASLRNYIFSKKGTSTKSIALFITASVLCASASLARVKGLKPFGFIKSKSRNLQFFRDWAFNWLPNSISFLTTINRFYFEQQTRSETDTDFQLPEIGRAHV